MTMIRAIAKIAFNHLGYDVRRVAKPNSNTLTRPGADPVTFEYLPKERGHAVFDVAISNVRAFQPLGMPLNAKHHPFVRALQMAVAARSPEECRDKIAELLTRYYHSVQPRSAAELIDLSAEEAPGLARLAPAEYIMPWSLKSIAETRLCRQRTATFEGLQNGVIADVGEGQTGFGPVKPSKVALEADRLVRLAKSIKSKGFVRFDPKSPLQVAALRRDGRYRWAIMHGQHRFAMAAALGIRTLPAMVVHLVRREDAPYWPSVVDGVFTEDGATKTFDRIFDGGASSVCDRWINAQG